MPDVNATADAAVTRLQAIMNRWPRPADGQGVRADAVAAGLRPLAPLAAMVLKLPVGYGKGYYEGVGYLSGSPRITPADLDTARAVLKDLAALPVAEALPLGRVLYGTMKAHAYKLLALAADLDVTGANLARVGTAAAAAWDPFISLAVVAVGGGGGHHGGHHGGDRGFGRGWGWGGPTVIQIEDDDFYYPIALEFGGM